MRQRKRERLKGFIRNKRRLEKKGKAEDKTDVAVYRPEIKGGT